MARITAAGPQPDALPAFLHRDAVQDVAVNLVGWSAILAAEAPRAPGHELLGVLRKMREALLLAIDETKALAALEERGRE